MPRASTFQADIDPRRRDHADLSRGQQQRSSPRLTLGPQERAAVSPAVLRLLGILATRDPATWSLEEMRQVQSWRDTAHRAEDQRAVAVLTKVLNLGARITQEHERQYRPLLQELRTVNQNLRDMRTTGRPGTTETIARHLADLRWRRDAREAGIEAAEKETEVWRANPADPRARTAIQAARAAAEGQVTLGRPSDLGKDRHYLDARREIDKRQNERFNHLADRRTAITKLLKAAGVPVPSEGSAA